MDATTTTDRVSLDEAAFRRLGIHVKALAAAIASVAQVQHAAGRKDGAEKTLQLAEGAICALDAAVKTMRPAAALPREHAS